MGCCDSENRHFKNYNLNQLEGRNEALNNPTNNFPTKTISK